MKKAIVTGANGFIGAWLVAELAAHEVQVYAVVKDERSKVGAIAGLPNVRFVYCELSRIQSLPEKIKDKTDVFYHLAWSGSAGAARTDAELQMQNALWTVQAYQAAARMGCGRFVGAGSIMEKETVSAVFAQGNKPGPAYIYGMGKLAAHCICKSLSGAYNTELIWGMITNAYGEGELSTRFINTTIRNILGNQPLHFTTAMQNYDFIHVEDVGRAFYAIGDRGKANKEYVIGSSQARPLREFIIELQQTLAPEAELLFGEVPFTGINMPLETFDMTETINDTGFRPGITFADGVRRTMKWLKRLEAKTDDTGF